MEHSNKFKLQPRLLLPLLPSLSLFLSFSLSLSHELHSLLSVSFYFISFILLFIILLYNSLSVSRSVSHSNFPHSSLSLSLTHSLSNCCSAAAEAKALLATWLVWGHKIVACLRICLSNFLSLLLMKFEIPLQLLKAEGEQGDGGGRGESNGKGQTVNWQAKWQVSFVSKLCVAFSLSLLQSGFKSQQSQLDLHSYPMPRHAWAVCVCVLRVLCVSCHQLPQGVSKADQSRAEHFPARFCLPLEIAMRDREQQMVRKKCFNKHGQISSFAYFLFHIPWHSTRQGGVLNCSLPAHLFIAVACKPDFYMFYRVSNWLLAFLYISLGIYSLCCLHSVAYALLLSLPLPFPDHLFLASPK